MDTKSIKYDGKTKGQRGSIQRKEYMALQGDNSLISKKGVDSPTSSKEVSLFIVNISRDSLHI